MKIAITSRLYFPLKGGVPVIVRLLGNAWCALGHEVRLLTSTAANSGKEEAEDHFSIVRSPSTRDLCDAARWCDVVFQMEVSIRMWWPFALLGRKVFVSHQTHFKDSGVDVPLYRHLQHIVARLSHPVSCSEVIKKSWGGYGCVIGNPYDEALFFPGSARTERPHPLLFVGRLIAAKGIDILLRALAKLKESGLAPTLRVIGDEWIDGQPQVSVWSRLADELGLQGQIVFLGALSLPEISLEMRQAKVLLVPSTWQEPFGIVAVEGVASGCLVIATAGGGLQEAGGIVSRYFQNGSVEELADAIRSELTYPAQIDVVAAGNHTLQHQSRHIAQLHLNHFSATL